ncbi:hypothetical protein [Streptosporangium carneum]|uniref:Lipoprotein n=1 Tax=Streptosporangium carneum TaxID=47481 RepID=A0A9W6I123_9ACTN|nr:hypothetical protein [Streptosporangium carneum]GLK09738.1 hypothetical protein GCM10017600_31440 [Streptosporangium carneum]
MKLRSALIVVLMIMSAGLSGCGCSVVINTGFGSCAGDDVKLSGSMSVESLTDACYEQYYTRNAEDILQYVSEPDRRRYFAGVLQGGEVVGYANPLKSGVEILADKEQAVFVDVWKYGTTVFLVCPVRQDVPAVPVGDLPEEVIVDGEVRPDGKVVPIGLRSGGTMLCAVLPLDGGVEEAGSPSPSFGRSVSFLVPRSTG